MCTYIKYISHANALIQKNPNEHIYFEKLEGKSLNMCEMLAYNTFFFHNKTSFHAL